MGVMNEVDLWPLPYVVMDKPEWIVRQPMSMAAIPVGATLRKHIRR